MQIFTDLAAWRTARAALALDRLRIGFVPTMGALHAGHLSLLQRARAECEHVVLSIFVNPTQFDDPADLARYPRTLEADLDYVRDVADTVLLPPVEQLYPDGFHYRIVEDDLSRRWEGAHRPGHFDGVLTVVLKLLQVAQAQQAYFGEKDWQQLELVRGLVRAFFIPTTIIACPTVREADGLALSSRNRRLSPEARARAARFPAALQHAPDASTAAQLLGHDGFVVDYVEDLDGRRIGAVRLEGVRLIDHVRL